MREVCAGQIYKHFKGNLVEVILIAKDSEVYKHLDTGEFWIRDKEMFLSPVDKVKYPDVEQEYRFEFQDEVY